ILAHPAEIMQHIDSDDFEALTVLGDESPYLEDTPAAKDLGYEVDMSISKFVMGPEGMDGEVRKKLQDIFEKSWESDEYQEFLEQNYYTPDESSPEEIQDRILKEADDLEKLI